MRRKEEEGTVGWKSWRVKGAQCHPSHGLPSPLLLPRAASAPLLSLLLLFNVPPVGGAAAGGISGSAEVVKKKTKPKKKCAGQLRLLR